MGQRSKEFGITIYSMKEIMTILKLGLKLNIKTFWPYQKAILKFMEERAL